MGVMTHFDNSNTLTHFLNEAQVSLSPRRRQEQLKETSTLAGTVNQFLSAMKQVDLYLTENAERHPFKALCWSLENAPYTELTIVCTINVSIDCKKNEVPNLLMEKIILYC